MLSMIPSKYPDFHLQVVFYVSKYSFDGFNQTCRDLQYCADQDSEIKKLGKLHIFCERFKKNLFRHIKTRLIQKIVINILRQSSKIVEFVLLKPKLHKLCTELMTNNFITVSVNY